MQENIKIGSIVKARSRLWRVDNIYDEIMEATPMDGLIYSSKKFLIPLEKINPAKIDLPNADTIGNPAFQDLLIRSFRLSLIHGTAPILCLQRSRIIPEIFQLVPVVMALEMPRVRMLIADDVGLGKTIEAGLIITELLARRKAKKVLVVCPASLRDQWKETLSYFFHINASIISSRHRREMERRLPPGSDPWEYFPYLIVSIDYAKEIENKSQILSHEWDIVVIDEAHNMAKPHQDNKYENINMARWLLARDLSKKCKHLLLLTATPHNGYTDTFASLLSILDIGAVSGPIYNPKINKDIALRHVCQRRRKDVEEELKEIGNHNNPFPSRNTEEVIVEPTELEQEIINMIDNLGKHIINTANLETYYKQRIAKWTVIHLHKRSLSSPRALLISLENRLKRIVKKIEEDDEIDEIGVKEPEAKSTILDSDPGEKMSEELAAKRLDTCIFGKKDLLIKEKKLVEDTLLIARKQTPLRDSKLQYMLSNTLRLLINERQKTIIFTKYKDTVDYLLEQIPLHRNFKGTQVIAIYGELNDTQRKQRFRDFENSKRAVMVATDSISEGLNLQYISSSIIHYELPWNPNRLEQRNGRIDRYGQPESVVKIKTMVVNDPLEAAILKVLIRKADTIRKDYGFSPPFFGDETSILDLMREQGVDISIGQTKLDIFCQGLVSTTKIDPFSNNIIDRLKEDNFYGQSSVDIFEVRKRIIKAEKLIGTRDDIKKFIESGLNKFDCRITSNEDRTFKLEIRDKRLLKNSNKSTYDHCSLDPLRGRNDPDVEVLDVGHPIVQNMISLVKELTFNQSGNYGRTACVAVKSVNYTTTILTFLTRYIVQTKPVSMIEELLFLGSEIYSDKVIDDENLLISIWNSQRYPLKLSIEEMKIDIKEAISKNFEIHLWKKAEERCKEIINERRDLIKKFEGKVDVDWIKGIDEISVSSVDLLTVTVYYPSR